MTEIHRSAIVPYPSMSMFDIVNDIESYPQFLPMCENARILEQTEKAMEATIYIKKGFFQTSFTTKNILKPGTSIEMELVDGPLESLQGRWSFTTIDSNSCEIELLMNFEQGKSLVTTAAAIVFEKLANKMLDAFCDRAHALHGNP